MPGKRKSGGGQSSSGAAKVAKNSKPSQLPADVLAQFPHVPKLTAWPPSSTLCDVDPGSSKGFFDLLHCAVSSFPEPFQVLGDSDGHRQSRCLLDQEVSRRGQTESIATVCMDAVLRTQSKVNSSISQFK